MRALSTQLATVVLLPNFSVSTRVSAPRMKAQNFVFLAFYYMFCDHDVWVTEVS